MSSSGRACMLGKKTSSITCVNNWTRFASERKRTVWLLNSELRMPRRANKRVNANWLRFSGRVMLASSKSETYELEPNRSKAPWTARNRSLSNPKTRQLVSANAVKPRRNGLIDFKLKRTRFRILSVTWRLRTLLLKRNREISIDSA